MSLPLHLVISEVLRDRITQGQYRLGEQIPSEHQLMAEFGASRTTIRRSLRNLVSQGLVMAYQGKGVFVTQEKKVTYSLTHPLVFLEEDMVRQGIPFSVQNLLFEKVSAPPDVQQRLQLWQDAPTVYLQKKLLLMNGVPGGVDITYVVPELGAAFGADLQQRMTFPVLEEKGVPIDRVEAILECTTATYEMSQYLDVPLGHPLILYRHTAYTQNDRPILHGESISRADRFCYSVTIQKQR
ncbi:MAG: GntR family transcriptional regulator [Prochlorotrichaceae cyanobacterium]|jgi:GntR family transcriptional regulator